MSKEYVWTLEVDEEEVIWKCVVTDDECVTYEDDRETSRIQITNREKKQGVLQLDTVTRVYDDELPFQLENGVPYIKVEDKWMMSDTTREERLKQAERMHKRNSYVEIGVGILLIVGYFIMTMFLPNLEIWAMVLFVGGTLILGGIWTIIRLRSEMKALGRKFSWKL